MPYTVVKDGVSYNNGPLDTLNALPAGEQRGTKLQAFFDANGIDFDLATGTGTDKSNLFFVPRKNNGKSCGFGAIFDDTDYRRDKIFRYNNVNMAANDNLRQSLHRSVFSSDLYIFRGEEKSPRKIYINDEGEIAMSEPIATFNMERMKPSKPNFIKQFFHWMNDDWFSSDFDKYEREKRYYDRFARELDQTKADIVQARADQQQRQKNEAADRDIIRMGGNHVKAVEKFDERVDNLLGPNPKDCPDLIEKGVYKEGAYDFRPLTYAEGHPFTDHEIAVMGFAAISNPEIAAHCGQNKYLDPRENTLNMYVHMTDDILYGGSERHNSGNVFMKGYDPARQKIRDCIAEYQKGNKEPLAKTLGECVIVQNLEQAGTSSYTSLAAAKTHATTEVLNILKKDPELLEKSGLTEKDISAVEARQKFADVYTKMVESKVKLARASLGEITITEEEKKECLLDIMSSNVLMKIEEKDMAETEKVFKKEYDDSVARLFEAQTEESMLRMKAGKVAPGTPERAALDEQVEDASLKNLACNTRTAQVFNKRDLSPAFKLFTYDGEQGGAYKAFREQIAETKTFKHYAAMDPEQIEAAQRAIPESSQTPPLLADTVKVLGELNDPAINLPPEKSVKAPVNAAEVSAGKKTEAVSAGEKMPDKNAKII